MKRHGHLFPRVHAFDNLHAAWRKAGQGKRHKPEVVAFGVDLEKNLHAIARQLREGSWRPGEYATFTVYEGKPRLIAAAPFRDRVVHHALVNVLEPLFEPTLIFDLYSNRRGKGTHAAVRRAQGYARQHPYVLHLDIRKYFPSIDRDILFSLLQRKVKCPETLDLIRRLLDIRQPGLETGLPMGNQTSQFFANLYLSPADHLLKEKLGVPGYLRYVDDMWLFGDGKPQLWAWKRQLETFLTERLHLALKPHGAALYRVADGFPCLGFRVLPEARLLKRVAVLRFRRRVRAMQAAYRAQRLSPDGVRATLMGTMGHFRQGDSATLRNRLLYEAVFSREPLPA